MEGPGDFCNRFEPITVGDRWRIVSPERPSSEDGRIDLVIGRGAFGSGEHETTASCLEQLELAGDLAGTTVLDLGSGTGVLAVAALQLGANRAICIDTSPAAIETARLNCALNHVLDRVDLVHGTLADAPREVVELVMANVYSDVLLEVAADLVGRVSEGGTLILSGMAWESTSEVKDRFRRLGCAVLRTRMLEEYSTLVLQRPSPS